MAQRTRVTGSEDTRDVWRAFRKLQGGVTFDGAGRAAGFRSAEAAIQFATAYPDWAVSIAQVVRPGMMLVGEIEVSPWLKA